MRYGPLQLLYTNSYAFEATCDTLSLRWTVTLFEWNDLKATSNRRKHGVSFDEAQTVFLDNLSIVVHDTDHADKEDRFTIIGMSKRRRLLIVVFTENNDQIRLISARKANRSERKQYE